jgi:hypothetical protein
MVAVSTYNTTFDGVFAAGILDATQGSLISFTEGSQLQGYDLASPLSFSGSGGIGNGGGSENIFPTTAGQLEFVRDQPPPLEAASVTAVLTQTLNGYQGGTASAPVYLAGGAPIGELTGTISGFGAEDYYSFYWGGGVFGATASITGASAGASYLFSAGVTGSCNSVGSLTLNSGDSFSGTISVGDLPAGQYCIGLDANSANDPDFSLTFNTPVSASPEPGAFFLLCGGLAAIPAARHAAKRTPRRGHITPPGSCAWNPPVRKNDRLRPWASKLFSRLSL